MAGLKIANPRRDGIEVVCEWTVTPLVNSEGSIISIIAQGRDILERGALPSEGLDNCFHTVLILPD